MSKQSFVQSVVVNCIKQAFILNRRVLISHCTHYEVNTTESENQLGEHSRKLFEHSSRNLRWFLNQKFDLKIDFYILIRFLKLGTSSDDFRRHSTNRSNTNSWVIYIKRKLRIYFSFYKYRIVNLVLEMKNAANFLSPYIYG